MLLLATPFISPVPARHSHAAGPAVRIPCLCMRSPCPLSSPSLDFSPIAFRPASCGARLAPRHLRTRPLLQVVMARGPSPSHAAWRLPAWCASPFALRPLLPRLPSTTSAGSGMASGSDISLCLHSRLLPSVPRTPRPCTSESRWVHSGQRTRTPTNPVSECSAIAGLVALTTAASRWRHCVPFVPFAAPLCSLFPRRVTCAPFENF